MAACHDQEASDAPFAIYALCDVDEDDILEIAKTCNSVCEIEGQVIRPPRQYFPGGRLRDGVQYHVGLAKEGQFDPKHFIVLACLDWRTEGVVIVTLDDEEMQCKPNLLWIKAEDAGLALVNLQISNMGWEELKEDSLDSTAPEDEDDNGVTGQSEDFGKAPGIGYHIGVYVRSDNNARALLREIEPAVDIKQPSEMVCKALRAVSEDEGSEGDLLSQAATAHPLEVKRHPTLHKRMFLVADNLDYSQDGLLLVDLDWDGETDGKSDEELKRIGKTANINSLPVGTHAGVAGNWAAVFMFSRIAEKGCLAKWRPKHILVGAYSVPYPDCDVKVQSAIDPRWDTRGSGQDRVVYAGSIEGADELDIFQICRKTFQAHLQFCERYRFATNLCKDYFIYCGVKELKSEDEVVEIKVQMSVEDILQVEESDLSDLERSHLEHIKCQASEAHALITEVVKGKKKWRGVSIQGSGAD
jgi:hypothetical protein